MLTIVFAGCGQRTISPTMIQLNLIGEYDYTDYTSEIYVSGGIVYLNAIDSGIIVIDARDPRSPQRASIIHPAQFIYSLDFSGDLAFLACGQFGFIIYDISDPYNPALVGEYNPQDSPGYGIYCVTIDGNIAYAGTGGDYAMDIVDIQNTASPELVGRLDASSGSGFDQIIINGNLAYARYHDMIENDKIAIIDISNASEPQLLGRFTVAQGGCRDMALGSRYLYFSSYQYQGLTALDTSDPSGPVIFQEFRMPDRAMDIFISRQGGHIDRYAYIADSDSGLQVVDIANPASPQIVESYDIGGRALSICREGQYDYLTKENYGVLIFEYMP